MKITVFHGSPRKGNTYEATRIFMATLSACAEVQYTEFFLPDALPVFCAGCQLCLSGPAENCPHSRYVTPLADAVLVADALVFTTPHHGACSMSGGMKTLLDHLDFLTMSVAPRTELFRKKAFILTTGAGSAAAAKPIRRYLQNWGVNRVMTFGLRMFTDKWSKLPPAKQGRFTKRLNRAARAFARLPKRRPHLSAVVMYHMSKFVLRRFIGADAYPYRHWQANGFFEKRPF